jgi:3-hydroxyacyl-[acyl-carrier-protein] dehydratase
MRFLLNNRIVSLVPGVSIVAEMSLPPEEELFRDHFPGFPVVPGVLLTEMMGQAASKCLVAERLPRGVPMLSEIRNARFRSWVRPGEVITLHASIQTSRESFAVAKCHATVGERQVCSTELLLSFLPADQFAPDYRDELLEQWLRDNP